MRSEIILTLSKIQDGDTLKSIIMKKYIAIVSLIFISTSCIDMGLKVLPLHSGADIINVNFEYRYAVENSNGYPMLAYVTLSNNMTIAGNKIDNILTVPPPSGNFTSILAGEANLGNIVCYMNLSNAATIEPIDGSPRLGTIADFSKPRKYRVTAADGTIREWTIVTSMN